MGKTEHLRIRPLSGALGAELYGVDLSRPPDDAMIAEIRQAFRDYLVIFFRDQELDPPQLLEFARRFGCPMIYPFVKGLADFPEVTPVIKQEDETINFGGLWHSDTAYLDVPPLGTMLYARQVPPVGGDTEFANMYRAYDTLSDGMKRMLEPLVGVNISGKGRVLDTRAAMRSSGATAQREDAYVAEHPVIRTHPETGRRSLYVNLAHTSHFRGFSVEESAPVLEFLFRHQVRPEFTCRFAWKAGSLAFWDNRCTQHNPLNDYHGYRREMHRVTLEGERPA